MKHKRFTRLFSVSNKTKESCSSLRMKSEVRIYYQMLEKSDFHQKFMFSRGAQLAKTNATNLLGLSEAIRF